MKGNRNFGNEPYTKRVDHEGGAHREEKALAEPTICRDCGAIYKDRRWTAKKFANGVGPALLITCPACKQIADDIAGGYVSISGKFFGSHRDEIEHLIKNEAAHTLEDNPLSRVMKWRDTDTGGVEIKTTTEHLAQRLGRALKKAYDGEVKYDFSHENKLARVTWHRD